MCLLLVLLQVWSVLRNISNLQVDSNRLNGTLPKVSRHLGCRAIGWCDRQALTRPLQYSCVLAGSSYSMQYGHVNLSAVY